jgi:predicted transposase YbfD/YdcC
LAPALLEELPLKKKIITGDALFAQKHLCQQILDRGGDYLFIVKGNQEHLHWSLQLLFEKPARQFHFDQAEQWSRHGNRVEVRRLWASTVLNDYLAWPGLKQVLKVEREVEKKGQKESQVRYAITSLERERGIRHLLNLVRGHWAIENKLFRVRDVTLGEDASQVRKGSAPQVMAALRNTVLALLRRSGVMNIAAAIRENGWQHQGPTLLNLFLKGMRFK